MTTPDITTRLRESEAPKIADWALNKAQALFAKELEMAAEPFETILSAYRSAFARHLMQDVPAWQPIETAPKDGTPFLVYLPQATWDVGLKPTVTVMFWAAWENFASLYADRIGESEGDAGDWIPTHWMPLPPTPSQIEEGNNG